MKSVKLCNIPRGKASQFLEKADVKITPKSVCYGYLNNEQIIGCCSFSPELRLDVLRYLFLKIGEVMKIDGFAVLSPYINTNCITKLLRNCPKLAIGSKPKVICVTMLETDTNDLLEDAGWNFNIIPETYCYQKDSHKYNKKTIRRLAQKEGVTEEEFAEVFKFNKLTEPQKLIYYYKA